MEVYKYSIVNKNKFDFENIMPYFKDPVARTRYSQIFELARKKNRTK